MKLKCMFDKRFLVHLGMVMVMVMVSSERLLANVTFSGSASAVLLDAQNSKLKIGNPVKVCGWGERSIVKSYGNAFANVWPEAYQVGSVVGQGGQPGVTAVAYTNLVDANSNAIIKFGGGTDGALSRANSNALLYGLRTTSNALLRGDRSNSGGVVYLTRLARSSSGSIGYLTKFARSSSGGVTYLTRLARTGSNALLFGDRTNSAGVDDLSTQVRVNSNTMLYGFDKIGAELDAQAEMLRTHSNAFAYGITNNSEAIVLLDANVRTISNATVYGIRNDSNTLLYLDRVGSNAIMALTTGQRVLAQTVRTDSNAMVYGIKNDSNTLLYLDRVGSNAVVALTTGQRVLAQTVRTDSNASVYGIKNSSNTLLYLHRADSNAIVALTTGQRVLAQTVRTDSNAMVYGIKNSSNTLLYLHRVDSDAVMALTTGQLVLAQTVRTDSNASMYGIKNNSNTMLYGFAEVGSEFGFMAEVVRTHSNAFAYGIANNSNAIIALTQSEGSALSKANSNALLYLHRVDSGAFTYGIANNSNAIIALTQSEGSALSKANSNALLYLNRVDSSAFTYGIANNSNAIIALIQEGGSALSKANSNALLYLHRVDSSAIIALSSISTDLITANSKAIVRLNNQVQTVFGPEPLVVVEPVYVMHSDVYLSDDHLMLIQPAAGPCIIDGDDHTISFANALTNLMQIASNVEVTLTNVVLKNYSEAAVLLGSGSRVTFGDNVRIEVDSDQLVTRDWAFTGNNAILVGNGNRLTLDIGSIIVRPSSSLHLLTIGIDGLKRNNLRCDAMSSSLVLEASTLYLTNNMSFSTGLLDIVQDVRLTGTTGFTFSSNQVLIVEPSSALHLDGITFAYQSPTNNRDAVVLVDRSSVLALDSCTLQSTTTGMRLTRGTLVVDGANKLVNTGALSLSEGFGIGNGNADDDLVVQIKPGASLNLVGGIIDYANVN